MLLGSWKSPGIFCNQEIVNPGKVTDLRDQCILKLTHQGAAPDGAESDAFVCLVI